MSCHPKVGTSEPANVQGYYATRTGMRRTPVALVLLVLLVVSPAIGGLLTAAGRGSIFVVAGWVLSGTLVATLAIQHYRTERTDDGGEGSWSPVPDWQYEGRFAESGGLARGEQSEEIGKVRTDAEEVERNRK